MTPIVKRGTLISSLQKLTTARCEIICYGSFYDPEEKRHYPVLIPNEIRQALKEEGIDMASLEIQAEEINIHNAAGLKITKVSAL